MKCIVLEYFLIIKFRFPIPHDAHRRSVERLLPAFRFVIRKHIAPYLSPFYRYPCNLLSQQRSVTESKVINNGATVSPPLSA
jgi:hypothetical protein